MSAWQGIEPQSTDHTDDPLPYLIAANERLHAEVQRLTDEHALLMQSIEQALSDPENQPSQFGTVPAEWWEQARASYESLWKHYQALGQEMWNERSQNLTLRADLATSEQTIAALKAQLQRVKEAAE